MLPDQTLDWPTVAPKRMMSSVPCIVAVRGRPRRRGYLFACVFGDDTLLPFWRATDALPP